MQHTIKIILQRAARFRKQLADLEAKMAQHGPEKPPKLWNELVQISRALDREEGKAQAALKLITEQVNQARDKISQTLAEYNRCKEQMRETEVHFLDFIVRPGYRLKQAARQREFLATEYNRIRKGIETGQYTHLEELEAEIRWVLSYGEKAYKADKESFEDEILEEADHLKGIMDLDVDAIVDEIQQDHLVREFKRVVLPATHPDTSDTPREIYENVYEVYQNRDYLLMDAYIAEYRGAYELDPEEDPVVSLESICTLQDRYQALLGRLKRRVERLVREMMRQELDDPEAVKQQMLRQRDEIRDWIQNETEQILDWRERLQELTRLYQDQFPNRGEIG